MFVAATTPSPFSCAMKSLKYVISTPHGMHPGIACKGQSRQSAGPSQTVRETSATIPDFESGERCA
eukprot:5623590-Pyramimonas_sp.AAC.1